MSLADTLHRLPPAATEYTRSLLDHHWLEASWSYERREVLYTQGALFSADSWLELEMRGNAYVAALVEGEHLTLEECEEKALEGDLGELHTAIRLLARTDQPKRFCDLVDRIEWQEPASAWAVADALTWDAPDTWRELVGSMLEDESVPDEALGSLARVAGSRGWALGESLLGVLEDRVGDLEAAAWAVGVLGVEEALPILYELIQEPGEPGPRQAAAIAALRFAPGQIVAFLEQVVAAEAWAAVPLALGGGDRAWATLSAAVKASPSPEGMLAVGLFGHVEGIDLLLDRVEDESCGEAAAEGLYVLTGALLHEEVNVPDPNAEPGVEDEDEDESAPGLLTSRLPCARAPWASWLEEQGGDLRERRGIRIRGGVPSGPLPILDEISRTNTSAVVRAWMVEELAVRYRLGVRAWPRLLQNTQRVALRGARVEVETGANLVEGDWSLAGEQLD